MKYETKWITYNGKKEAIYETTDINKINDVLKNILIHKYIFKYTELTF